MEAIAATTGMRVRCVSEPRPGKSHALNTGLAATRTDLVITVDADTLLHRRAVRHLVARLLSAPGDVRAVAGSVLVRNSRDTVWTRMQEWDYFLGIASVKRMQGLYQGHAGGPGGDPPGPHRGPARALPRGSRFAAWVVVLCRSGGGALPRRYSIAARTALRRPVWGLWGHPRRQSATHAAKHHHLTCKAPPPTRQSATHAAKDLNLRGKGAGPTPGSPARAQPRPAFSRSRAARSVRSQVNSGSSRPKWP